MVTAALQFRPKNIRAQTAKAAPPSVSAKPAYAIAAESGTNRQPNGPMASLGLKSNAKAAVVSEKWIRREPADWTCAVRLVASAPMVQKIPTAIHMAST